ncbi:hypothetical protein BC827DRAFT_886128 [Russula dissimulans]|nr:hypothetical protein BC827DRAFT_886128 [Russula dissimulans]
MCKRKASTSISDCSLTHWDTRDLRHRGRMQFARIVPHAPTSSASDIRRPDERDHFGSHYNKASARTFFHSDNSASLSCRIRICKTGRYCKREASCRHAVSSFGRVEFREDRERGDIQSEARALALARSLFLLEVFWGHMVGYAILRRRQWV